MKFFSFFFLFVTIAVANATSSLRSNSSKQQQLDEQVSQMAVIQDRILQTRKQLDNNNDNNNRRSLESIDKTKIKLNKLKTAVLSKMEKKEHSRTLLELQ